MIQCAYDGLFEEYTQGLETFAVRITDAALEYGISEQVSTLHADHACLRLSDSVSVQRVRETLLTLGKELSAAIVNGRAIYIFELSTPVRVGNWDIPCVELPMPKVNHAYLDGWEHIEFVLPGTENKPIEVLFAETFPRILIEELKSRGVCSISTPQVSGEQLSNETLELKASNGVSLKFHRWGIKEVVGNTKG